MNGKHLRRLTSGIAAVSLVALSIGSVSAAGTRVLYVGGLDGQSDGTITLQPANVGTVTYTDVLIRNDGKQTLSNGQFGIGSQIAPQDASGNTGKFLPDGWAVADISTSSGTCQITASGDGASCSLGNLPKGAKRTIRVYLYVGSTAGPIEVSGKVAENTGGNVGSNTNTFYADATTTGVISEAVPGQITGYFKGNQTATPSVKGNVPTQITLGSSSSYLPVSINENSTFSSCPNGTCLPGASEASVNGGATVPAFLWTSYFPVPAGTTVKNSTTLYHYFDGGTQYEALTSKNSCSKGKVPCVDFTITTIDGLTYLQVDFKTTKNGYTKTRL